MHRSSLVSSLVAVLVVALLGPQSAAAARSLRYQLGASEVRVVSTAPGIRVGDFLRGSALADRLTAQGYRRVRAKPTAPGEFFWGFEKFWIYHRALVLRGRPDGEERLIEISKDQATGLVLGIRLDGDERSRVTEIALEPVVLAETLSGRRARRQWIAIDRLPEHTWRAVLAIEDARFFEHGGVDPRSVARALLKNAKAGKVTQGGSTITQQLIKIRDLTPRRTLGRKVSEAVRALALEAEHSKREILEAYLNSVYLGHVGGVSIYGFGAASRAYYGKSATRLSLGESALLAGMIQGPNRLHPGRHPQRAVERQRAVLGRLGELEWVGERELEQARRAGLPRLRLSAPMPSVLPSTLAWIRDDLESIAPRRARENRGVVVETTLDAHLQSLALEAVGSGLEGLERKYPKLRRKQLSAALVAVDATNGDVLAAVGADPRRGDDFDRIRLARRQPGSTVKPFVLLEALDDCGARAPLYNSRLIADRPLVIELEKGTWSPVNPDRRHRGTVDLRTALVDSLNVPLVRVARWCGFDATADRFRAAGLEVPPAPPPSFVLGSLEVSPLELAEAFTTFATLGRRHRPRIVRRAAAASGRGLGRAKVRSVKVVRPSTAYLVRDLLRQAGSRALGAEALEGHAVFGKTGTSSDRRDAWFAGAVGRLVIVVWVGLDDGASLGLSGSQAAVPIWRSFAERSAAALEEFSPRRPRSIVERWIDPKTGLRMRSPRKNARRELYRDGDEPQKRRLLFRSEPERPIE